MSQDNLLFVGDNLTIMQNIVSNYSNKIKCIYIDPPYNTGQSFIYNDNYKDSWLNFMKPRLTVAREFLTEDGIICISIDDHESHYLRVLLDQIYGRQNYVGTFIRKTKSSTNDVARGFNIQHEECIIYAKNIKEAKLIGEKKDFKNYIHSDSNGAFSHADPSAPKNLYSYDNPTARTGSYFPITNPYTGKVDYPPKNRAWRFCKSTFEKYVENGTIEFRKEHKPTERGFYFKRYKLQVKSIYNPVNSLVFTSNEYMNQAATKETQKLGLHFSYPKPVAFIKKIIQYCTQQTDIILDFFAGSGTTGQAVAELNQEDNGNRTFILIQYPEPIKNSHQTVSDITKQRLSLCNIPYRTYDK